MPQEIFFIPALSEGIIWKKLILLFSQKCSYSVGDSTYKVCFEKANNRDRDLEHKERKRKISSAGYGIRFEKNRHSTNVNATVDIGLQSITWVPTAHKRKPKYPGWRINLYG